MYRIHITEGKHSIGSDPVYNVAVILPGQSFGNVAPIGQHNLEVILYELVPANAVKGYLAKAHTADGALIELSDLSEQHFNMLRGLPPKAVGR